VSLLRRLAGLLRGPSAGPGRGDALTFYVRCSRCGEVIRVRADRRWDLLQEYDEGVTGYTLHKDVLGVRCNQLMHLRVAFDPNYRVTEQDVEGGSLTTPQAYEAFLATAPERHPPG